MSTAAALTPEDRALVRRFGFLGLPSERVGGALSFSGLRAELGDDNAASLVMRLGVLIKVHHLDQLGVSLDRAVDHILQSLTPDERRSIAAGNAVPPRVEALISAEADAAKFQKRAEDIHGPTATNAIGIGLGLRGAWLGKQGILAGGNGDGGTSARFDSINGGPPADGNWGSPAGQAYMRNYAMEHGLSWAADNPGLLRLGPAAIQTLADVKLKQESYDRFKKVGLDNNDIVAGARYAKKHGVDYNEASKAMEEVHKGLTPDKRQHFRRGLHDLYCPKPGEEAQAPEKFNKVMDGFKPNHPDMHEGLEKVKRVLGTVQHAERKADAKVDAVFGAPPTAPVAPAAAPAGPKGKASPALAPN